MEIAIGPQTRPRTVGALHDAVTLYRRAIALCESSPSGRPCDVVLGHAVDHNRGASLSWPYSVTVSGSTAVIADSGNDRILLWELAS